MPVEFRATFFSYRGRSMWPLFQEGDLLEVQSVTIEMLRVGDCITYRSNDGGTLVTHRIINICEGAIYTRGDAYNRPDDDPVRSDQLCGRVTGRYRMGVAQMVAGGYMGQLIAGFYRYAGRLDPQRKARGGNVARLLRSNLQFLMSGFYRRGWVREFKDAEHNCNYYWMTGQRSWARYDCVHGCWLVPWPQSLLIDPARISGIVLQ